MNNNLSTTHPEELIECFRAQNYYQRLGFRTNDVTDEDVDRRYKRKLRKLQRNVDCLDITSLRRMKELVHEAHTHIHTESLRAHYDSTLCHPDTENATGERVSSDRSAPAPAAEVVPPESAATAKSALISASTTSIPPAPDSERLPAAELLLGRYQVGDVISTGDRATICEAFDARLKRRVVVKRIRSDLKHKPEFIELFRQEAESFAKCNAANLVKILDYDIESGSIVLEGLSHDVSRLAQGRGVEEESAREILRGALTGLAFLHSNGIAHGRVELSHLLIDDQGGIKLSVTPAMTGIATAMRPGKQVRHLAPELLNSEIFGEPGVAIDIYALGFLCLELLCGKRFAKKVSPIVGGNQSRDNWLLWHASPTDHLPPIKSLVPSISEPFATLIQQMTSKQQHERFTDATQCLEALRTQAPAPIGPPPAIEGSFDQEDEVKVLGAPSQLHGAVNAPKRITWREVIKEPAVLLRPEGRWHLAYTSLGALTLASFAVLLSQPEGASPSATSVAQLVDEPALTFDDYPATEHQFDETADSDEDSTETLVTSESPAENATDEPTENQTIADSPSITQRKVSFQVTPNGVVRRVDEKAANMQNVETWFLNVGQHRASCYDAASDREFEVEFSVPEGQGDLIVCVPVPPGLAAESMFAPKEEVDPFEDVRGIDYTPSAPAFDLVGAKSMHAAADQVKVLRKCLREIAIEPYRSGGELPFKLPEYPTDPRFSFLMALRAHQRGELEETIRLCQRSLNEAKHFQVPFVIPMRLLIHTRARRNSYSTIEYMYALDWLQTKPQFADAADEVVWMCGLLTEFVRQAKSQAVRSRIDLKYCRKRLGDSCTKSQLEKYRIGCRDLDDMRKVLVSRWAKVHGVRGAGDGEGDANATNPFENEENDTANLASPHEFASYHPLDVSSLADAAARTIRMPTTSSLARKWTALTNQRLSTAK